MRILNYILGHRWIRLVTGMLFERPPTDAELAQARAALDAIIRRVRPQKPS